MHHDAGDREREGFALISLAQHLLRCWGRRVGFFSLGRNGGRSIAGASHFSWGFHGVLMGFNGVLMGFHGIIIH